MAEENLIRIHLDEAVERWWGEGTQTNLYLCVWNLCIQMKPHTHRFAVSFAPLPADLKIVAMLIACKRFFPQIFRSFKVMSPSIRDHSLTSPHKSTGVRVTALYKQTRAIPSMPSELVLALLHRHMKTLEGYRSCIGRFAADRSLFSGQASDQPAG